MIAISCPSQAEIDSYRRGQIDEDHRRGFEEHLATCPTCRQLVHAFDEEPIPTRAIRNLSLVRLESMKIETPLESSPSLPPFNDLTQVESPDTRRRVILQMTEPDSEWLLDLLIPSRTHEELGYLGQYRILKILGKGGMGAVLLAEDSGLQRQVALKILLPEMASRHDAKERFLREARVAAKIEHDNIVHIYQVGEDRGVPYIAMQLLKGTSLDEWLSTRRDANPRSPATAPQILRIGREIAQGLAAAHAHQLIHRDIKPANIWLDSTAQERVKILDFGLARFAGRRSAHPENHLTETGTVMGTPAYMAPEQARGLNVDGRCDLFSLGSVLYVLCTGQLPFRGNDTFSILTALAVDTPTVPMQLNPEIPPALSNLVMKLLEKDPQNRLQSAEEVVRAIQALERNDHSDQTEAVALAFPLVAPRVEPIDPWANIDVDTDFEIQSNQQASSSSKIFKPKSGRTARWIAAAAGAILSLMAGIVFFLPSKDGTLRVEIDDPEIEVSIKGTNLVLKNADQGKEVTLEPGEKHIRITRGDFTFETDKLVLKKGEHVTVKVDWLPGKMQLVQDGKVIAEKAVPKAIVKSPKEKESTPKPKEPVVSNTNDPVRHLATQILTRGGRLFLGIPNVGDREVSSLDQLPKEPFDIRRMQFSSDKSSELGDNVFEGLDFTHGSSWFSIHSPNFTDAGIEKLLQVPGVGHLDDLGLNDCRMTDRGLEQVAKLEGLKQLSLGSVRISGTGFAAFQENLQSLVMFDPPLTVEGMAAIGKMPGLTYFNLSGTRLTPKHLEGLVGSKLQTLYLVDVGLTDEGLQHLTEIESLEILVINRNEITPKGLKTLTKLKNLKSLEVRNNKMIREVDLRYLLKEMPELKIHSIFKNLGPK